MALVLADRVQQTGVANTTVSFTLSGSVTGFQSFAAVGNGNTTYYSAFDASGNWEVGVGTYATGGTLTRTTIISSSNSGSAVTFSGTVDVFVTYPSGKSVNQDASGNVGIGTTTPTKKLEVAGSIMVAQDQAATTGAVTLRQNSADTVPAYLQWVNNADTAQKGFITVSTSNVMQFGNSSSAVTMSLDDTGRRTNAYQTFFGAKKDNGVDVSAVTYPTVFNNGYYNIGSAYNVTTGLFTAPVAGRYLFQIEGLSTLSTVLEMSLFVNGGFFLSGRNVGSAYASTAYCTAIIQLNAGDTVGVNIAQGTMYGSGFNQFTGYLLG